MDRNDYIAADRGTASARLGDSRMANREREENSAKAAAYAQTRNEATLTKPGPSSILETIEARIADMTDRIRAQTYRLNDHARALHGPWPEESITRGEGNGRDRPEGILYRITDALDELSSAEILLGEAVVRNTNLA